MIGSPWETCWDGVESPGRGEYCSAISDTAAHTNIYFFAFERLGTQNPVKAGIRRCLEPFSSRSPQNLLSWFRVVGQQIVRGCSLSCEQGESSFVDSLLSISCGQDTWFSLLLKFDRGPIGALRRSTLDFCLGGQRSSTPTRPLWTLYGYSPTS